MNNELAIAKYFLPNTLRHIPITEDDETAFIEWASKGMHKDRLKKSHFSDGFNALVYGKKYAGITMGLWEQGVLDGSTPYFTLLGGFEGQRKWYNPMRYIRGRFYNISIPRFVVDFMKGEMFKGADADIIEDCYDKI